jgi:hypothetical protein
MEILSLLWSLPLNDTAADSPMRIAAAGDANPHHHGCRGGGSPPPPPRLQGFSRRREERSRWEGEEWSHWGEGGCGVAPPRGCGRRRVTQFSNQFWDSRGSQFSQINKIWSFGSCIQSLFSFYADWDSRERCISSIWWANFKDRYIESWASSWMCAAGSQLNLFEESIYIRSGVLKQGAYAPSILKCISQIC